MQVAEGVYRGFESIINFYLFEEGGRLTLVDAGLRGNWDVLERTLREAGRTPSDIEAVLLTHAHPDHTGLAERLRADYGSRLYIHEADHGYLLGKGRPKQGNMLPALRHMALLKLVWYFVSKGILMSTKVADAASFGDGEQLDVPGRPRVLHTPGHTPGSASLVFEGASILCTGDALATMNWVSGETGPTAPPSFSNSDPEEALRSLDLIASVEAALILPGHGEPWRGTPADAVQIARSKLAAG